MNPKRRRSHRSRPRVHRRRSYRRRRHNPVSYFAAPARRHRRRSNPRVVHVRRRRSRNPLALSARELIPTALWAIAGGVATRAIPQMFLKEANTGIMGYGANAVTTVALAWAADRFISPNAGKGILLGGAVMLGGRLISDFLGKELVSFGVMGAYGDPSFDLGIYTPGQFLVPTWSEGQMQRQNYPFYSGVAAAPALPAPRGKGLGYTVVDASGELAGTQRLRSRFST